MITHKNKRSILKLISLICYIICVVILITESCINGTDSANHSNNVGSTIAGIVNNLGGDKTVIVEPTKLIIDNKISEANIGDVYELKTTTLPENSTYKALIYQTSDVNIASIDESGKISFKSKGKVTITVINEKNNLIKDNFDINVKEVEASKITASISNASLDENGIYTLYVENSGSYYINTYLEPKNITIKKIKVVVDKTDYLNCDLNSGQLINLKDSNGKITTITLTIGKVSCALKVIVDTKNKVKLTEIKASLSKNQIYVGENLLINVSCVPNNASYQDYSISTDKEDIVLINNNNIIGKNPGKVTLTIQSLYDNSIKKDISIEVLRCPDITDFELKYDTLELIENQEKTIEFKKIEPTIYGNIFSLDFSSDNPLIASVSASGRIKAIKEGKTTITVNTKTVHVIVKKYNPIDFDSTYQEKENHISGFSIVNTSQIITFNNNKSLNEIFEVLDDNWLYDNTGNTKNIDKTIRFFNNHEMISTANELEPGKYQLLMLHLASGFNKEVTLIVLDDCNIYNLNDIKLLNEQKIEIKAKNKFDFKLKANKNNYKIILTDKNNNYSDDLLIERSEESYSLKSIYSEGSFKLKIIPLINYVAYEEYANEYQIEVTYNYLKEINYYISDAKNNKLEIIDNTLDIFMNQNYYINQQIDSDISKYNFSYSCDNNQILKVTSRGKITPLAIGKAIITITDEVSQLQTFLNINVKNLILINQEKKVTLTGSDTSYDESLDTYTITNGISSTLKVNFLSNSTYKQATYTSLDESVLSISKDGIITPHKEGKTKISIVIDDGQIKIENIEINIQVKNQTLIKNLTDFLVKTRKALGHFGAFMIMGIFSTLTYMLYIKRNKWDLAILINLLQGFFLAMLTEIIQLFVPNRSGLFSDVLIDFSGFMISYLVLTIYILVCHNNKKKTHQVKRIIRKL